MRKVIQIALTPKDGRIVAICDENLELDRLRRFKIMVYERIEILMALDPCAGTSDFVELKCLAELCERWEKKEYPITQSDENKEKK